MATATHAAPPRQWLAGDHHVHSRFSGKVKDGQYVLGADGIYTIPKNAEMAQAYGLKWFVSTDHGGLGLSQLHYDQTWPEVLAAREATPNLIIFYGMEFDTPGGDHSSIILPINADEREHLRRLEHTYAKHEVDDPARDTTENMLKALRDMNGLSPKPLVFAHHPSRSAKGIGDYHGHTPWELRAWHDTAPKVAVGMEGAP
ncbi:MAG: phosphoesterase, partial [Asticcacaulis sp. 32-58-5]